MNKMHNKVTHFSFSFFPPILYMDDIYQYTAISNNNNTNEEEDVILNAFSNMGWGKKWTSLVNTVKKQVQG